MKVIKSIIIWPFDAFIWLWIDGKSCSIAHHQQGDARLFESFPPWTWQAADVANQFTSESDGARRSSLQLV